MGHPENVNKDSGAPSGLNVGLGWPTPKQLPTIIKQLKDCKYYAENGLLYMNDGGKEQNLIASFRIAGRSAEQEKRSLILLPAA